MKKFYQLIVASLLLTVTATAAAQESPILTLPEGGTTKLYQRAGGAYYAILGNQFGNIEYSYLPSEIVDYDLAEALAMKRTVDPKLVSLANILSI